MNYFEFNFPGNVTEMRKNPSVSIKAGVDRNWRANI